jgi:hypothetical protein
MVAGSVQLRAALEKTIEHIGKLRLTSASVDGQGVTLEILIT